MTVNLIYAFYVHIHAYALQQDYLINLIVVKVGLDLNFLTFRTNKAAIRVWWCVHRLLYFAPIWSSFILFQTPNILVNVF